MSKPFRFSAALALLVLLGQGCFSQPVPTEPAEEAVDSAPVGEPSIDFSAATDEDGIRLKWQLIHWPNMDDPSVGYVRIAYGTSTEPSFENDQRIGFDPSITEYVAPIFDGRTYTFEICSQVRTDEDVCATASAKAPVKREVSTPSINGTQYVADELAITNVFVDERGVTLTWNARTTPNFVSYKIVRSSSTRTPTYPKDGAIATITNRDRTSYIDTNIRRGTEYTYRVCAVEQGGPVVCANEVRIVTP